MKKPLRKFNMTTLKDQETQQIDKSSPLEQSQLRRNKRYDPIKKFINLMIANTNFKVGIKLILNLELQKVIKIPDMEWLFVFLFFFFFLA